MKKTVIYFIILLTICINSKSSNAQSPYELNDKNEAVILSCGFGFAVARELLTRSVQPLRKADIISLSKYDINRFDRSAVANYSPQLKRVSDVLLGTCILSPTLLLLNKKTWADRNTIMLMHFESMLLTGFLTRLIKTSGRIRPLFYNPDVPLNKKLGFKHEANASFPSGHTSVSFASAVLLSKVFCDFYPESKYKPYVWVGSLSIASLVGYLRYASGVHFPTDILAGAVLGSAIGYLVPHLHKKRSVNNLSIQPSYLSKQIQMAIIFTF